MSYYSTAHRSLRYCASFIAVLMMCLELNAQEQPTTTRATLTTLAWDKPVRGLYYMNHGKIEVLKAYSGGFSMAFPYEGDSVVRFYADKQALQVEPEHRPAPVATVQLNPNLKHILLIFITEENAGYKILQQNFSQKEFPPQSCRIINFSDLNVSFAFGDQPKIYTVGPHDALIVHLDGEDDEKQMVKVQIAQAEGEKQRLIYRSYWGFQEQSRSTVFILPTPNDQGSVKLRKFVERGLKPEQDTSAPKL